ncbi:T9SS type A sorting domain-containing protein [Hymenobacter sp. BT664]|uniref:T9SS type A sorting domain-containing protein n=1 Tax=Hymenobacter montanus TaxID=2771359 RepID=A0A927BAX1_9BACT|nr:T9SS type A sorting domain-containing protein [Hymenobacter montanus]MBD2766773.1 T9SS type A sorting domain-containing protein [Hymenobacter montanus]
MKTISLFKWCLKTIVITSLFLIVDISLAQTLPGTYFIHWGGNTGENWDNHVQITLDGMYVAPDGRVYTNSNWDESAHQASIYKDGKFVSQLEHPSYGHYQSDAVGNATHIFINFFNGDLSVRPAGIRRYNLNGETAPFRTVATPTYADDGSFLAVNQKGVHGLAIVGSELFAGDPEAGLIKVYDTNTLSFLRSFAYQNPYRIVAAPDNTLWFLQDSTSKIQHYDINGNFLGQEINSVAKPSCMAFDRSGRMLIGDRGPDQDIKIYANVNTNPVLMGTFGVRGGILALPNPGETGPLRFHNPIGIGVDREGNIYVGCNGAGTVIESYKPDGTRRNWKVEGLVFEHGADADEMSDAADYYTQEEHMEMDFSKPAGQSVTYKGFTKNSFKYPEDARDNTGYNVGSGMVRYIAGKKILFVTDQGGGMFAIYRFNKETDGEIAIPSGFFAGSYINSRWPNFQPFRPDWQTFPGYNLAGWIWRDSNGNGKFDANEYVKIANNVSWPWEGISIDRRGDIWTCKDASVSHFKCQGLDSFGNPIWDFEHAETHNIQGFTKLCRVEYDAEKDVMYLSGYTAALPYVEPYWGLVGRVLKRYNQWSLNWQSSTPPTAWQTNLTFVPASAADNKVSKSMTIAGDYIFVAVFAAPYIEVYSAVTGVFLGRLNPSTRIYGQDIDSYYGIHAYKKRNGQYVVYWGEYFSAKTIIYVWNPTIPAGWKAESSCRSTTLSWGAPIEGNPEGYNIYRSFSQAGSYQKINNSLITGASFTDNSLENGKEYFYKIVPVTRGAEGLISEALKAVAGNVALYKPARQSSTPDEGRNAELATDGITTNSITFDSVFFSPTHTYSPYALHAWWQTDLGRSFPIDSITVWYRTNCCRPGEYSIFLSETPFLSNDLTTTRNQAGVSTTTVVTNGFAGIKQNTSINRRGRYLRLQLNYSDPLELIEVQVWNSCSPTVLSSVSANREDNLFLYPNPASSEVRLGVKLTKPSAVKIAITDMVGRTIMEFSEFHRQSFNKQLDLSKLAVGIYMVNVTIDNVTSKGKLLEVR